MKLIRVDKQIIVNDDGTQLTEKQNRSVQALMELVIDAKVLGSGSPVSKQSALRMAAVAMAWTEVVKRNNMHVQFGEFE